MSMRLGEVLVRLQDTTAEIRVRLVVLLLIGFVALAQRLGLGLETILGAFLAGALVRVPVFLAALLVVRGVPALLFARSLGARGATAAGLLQATSLPFPVTAAQIGCPGPTLQRWSAPGSSPC